MSRFILFIVLTVFFLVALRFLLVYSIEWKVKAWSQENLAARLEYKEASWHWGSVELSGVTLKRSSEEKLPFDLHVDKLTLNYSLSLSQREIDLHFDLEHPTLYLIHPSGSQEPSSDAAPLLEELAEKIQDKRSYLSVKFEASIGPGKLVNDSGVIFPLLPIKVFYGGDLEPLPVEGLNLVLRPNHKKLMEIKWKEANLALFLEVLKELKAGLQFFSLKQGVFNGECVLYKEPEGLLISGTGLLTDALLVHRDTEMEIELPKVAIELKRTPLASYKEETLEALLLKSQGRIELMEPATFLRKIEGDITWGMKEITGHLFVNEPYAAYRWELQGNLFTSGLAPTHQARTAFIAQGEVPFSLTEGKKAFIGIKKVQQGQRETSMTIELQGAANNHVVGELDLVNWGAQEYDLISHLGSKLESLRDFTLQEGSFSAHAHLMLDLTSQELAEKTIAFSKIEADHLKFSCKDPLLEGELVEVRGDLLLSAKDRTAFSLTQGHLSFREGKLKYAEMQPISELNGALWIQEGLIVKGELEGQMASLKGKCRLYGPSAEVLGDWELSGQFKDIPFFVSTSQEFFPEESVFTSRGEIKNLAEELLLTNKLQWQESEPYEILLEAKAEYLRENHGLIAKSNHFGITHFEEVQEMGSFELPLLAIQWLQKDHLIRPLQWQTITLSSDQLPLEKFSSMLPLFQETTSIKGRGKVQAQLSSDSLLVHLDAKDVLLETETLQMKVAHIGNELGKDERNPFVLFDFHQHSSKGYLPLHGITFLDKTNQLLFTEGKAALYLSNGQLHMENVDVDSEGMHFKGRLDLNLADPKGIGLFIETEQVKGSFESLYRFVRHFKPWDELAQRLSGTIYSDKNGFVFEALFPSSSGQESEIYWRAHAKLEDGHYLFSDTGPSLKALQGEFYYDSKTDDLRVEHLSGNVCTNTNENCYELSAAPFLFKELKKGNFDIFLKAGNLDKVRLKGDVERSWGETRVSLDSNLSHLGRQEIQMEKMVFQEDELVGLKASCLLDLTTLSQDIDKLALFNLSLTDSSLASFLEESPLQGKVQMQIEFGNEGFQMNISGDRIVYKEEEIEPFLIQGHSVDRQRFILERVQVGSLSLTANLQKEGDDWKIEQAHLWQGKALVVDIKGLYQHTKRALSLHIEQGTLNLEQARKFLLWKHFLEPWNASGNVQIQGDVEILPGEPKNNYKVIGDIQARLEGLHIRGASFYNDGPIELTFSSQEGLKVEGIDLNIKSQSKSPYQISLALKSAHYEVKEDMLSVEGLNFSLTGTELVQISKVGQELFPDLFDSTVCDFLKEVQCKKDLKGSLQLKISSQDLFVKLIFNDGKYLLWGQEYDLKNVYLDIDRTRIRLGADCNYQQASYRVLLEVDRHLMNKGKISVSDLTAPSGNPLLIQWEGGLDRGFIIKGIQGQLAGLDISLRQIPANYPHHIALTGFIKLIDGAKLVTILPDNLAAVLKQIHLERGLELNGQFFFPRSNWQEMSFQGGMLGRSLTCMGYKIQSLSASVQFNSKQLAIKNLQMNDPAGKITIPEAYFKKERVWTFSIPQIQVHSFIPSLWCKSVKGKSLKNLVIKDMKLNQFAGELDNLRSYVATGSFYFENTTKKNLFERALLMIPSELIGRLGLNPNVLQPAMGNVDFAIRGERVYLTDLRAVYSEEKKSRFYLPKGEESYIDFNGNLHLNLAMKQYNLLFKFAEHLQITIRGTFEKPHYSLQKP